MNNYIENILSERIMVLDGAMGTMIQNCSLGEKDFRGSILIDHPIDLRGNNDILSFTAPTVISAIHKSYLDAGADIIETNTFNANRISQKDYGTERFVNKMNSESAQIARKIADEYTIKTPAKPRFVCGVLGPTNKTASLSPDIDKPELRSVTFDELQFAYKEQAMTLINGKVDLLMVETIFDTLNAKAALVGIAEAFKRTKKVIPLMVSVTVTDTSGRTLSGQTIEAFYYSVNHANLFSVGLNCSFGAKQIKPYLQELASVSNEYISVHPNAGMPNEIGEYDDTPSNMAKLISEFAKNGLVNIVGGCCGSTPEHIEAIVNAVKNIIPRRIT
jgi:5-methyltetrahydrofolate--homocysteine methyltransferase